MRKIIRKLLGSKSEPNFNPYAMTFDAPKVTCKNESEGCSFECNISDTDNVTSLDVSKL